MRLMLEVLKGYYNLKDPRNGKAIGSSPAAGPVAGPKGTSTITSPSTLLYGWMQPRYDTLSAALCALLTPSRPTTSLVTLLCIRVDAVLSRTYI
jgi:hypothetical protein